MNVGSSFVPNVPVLFPLDNCAFNNFDSEFAFPFLGRARDFTSSISLSVIVNILFNESAMKKSVGGTVDAIR